MEGLFVTGTSTEVGKSIVSAALVQGLRGSRKVAAYKPVVTGIDEPRGQWPPDHELLADASGWQTPEQVTPLWFGPAVSPHLAAEMSGCTIDLQPLLEPVRELGREHFVITEGVGGLLVPLNDEKLVLDFARDLGLPVIVVASPGLGSINHTLLTLESARGAGLEVAAVVMNPWPDDPSRIEISNEQTIARLGNVRVLRFPHVTREVLRSEGERLARGLGLID